MALSVTGGTCLARYRVAIWLLIALITLTSSSSVAASLEPQQTFRNCKQLRAKYPLGIAASKRIAGQYPAEVSASVYRRNVRFDFDLDGIACENDKLQANLAGVVAVTTPATTTPQPSTACASALPPNSEVQINVKQAVLCRGATYYFFACWNNSASDWTLEVLSAATAWTFKAQARGLFDSSRCPKPGYPFKLVFAWNVTEMPGEVSALRVAGYAGNVRIPVEIVS